MSFADLQITLAQWPRQAARGDPPAGGLFERIQQSLANAHPPFPDLLPLLRHVLARESAHRARNAVLRVPAIEGWPGTEEYGRHGMRATPIGDGTQFLIEALPWTPAWLGHDRESDIFSEIFEERSSDTLDPRPIDPAVGAATHFSSYTTPGQRAAVHGVLMAAPRSTLVIAIPTGSGKSLVAQAPALLGGEGACTVVVVPTVSLAMDQARQFEELWRMHHPRGPMPRTAWHANLADSEKSDIRSALRTGRQPILFTSPESVLGSLRMALYDAVVRGYLKYLVIDEAHLVAQWGDSFRPEFQALAAFRSALLSNAPGDGFKTVLMTATLTQETLSTLETLYADGRPANLIASVYLRGEPRYWFARANDEAERNAKVLEILRNAPRPLVLYTTEIEHAQAWYDQLRRDGHRRVGLFHGETGSTKRQELIDAWASARLDVMVATSAFGVGIDKRDVRCIVHACVPESLDRFYQEVGRGGRDGHASAAVTVYTSVDLHTARGIASPRLITGELGLPRWQEMIRQAQPTAKTDLWRVDLATVAPYLHQAGGYNRAWNLRTLMLLTRAGVIDLAAEAPDRTASDDAASDELSDEALRQIYDSVLVRILDARHRDPIFWETHIGKARQRSLAVAMAGVDSMVDVLGGKLEVAEALSELYTIDQPDRSVIVAASCSGCPACRRVGLPLNGPTPHPVVRPFVPDVEIGTRLWTARALALGPPPIWIVFDPEDPHRLRRFEQLVRELRTFELREVCVDPQLREDVARWSVFRTLSEGFVALTSLSDNESELSQVPRLTILSGAGALLSSTVELDRRRSLEWILIPANAEDPYRRDRRFTECHVHVRLAALLERLAR